MVQWLPTKEVYEETRGLSQRELILLLMEKFEKLNEGVAKRPTRTELYGTIGAVLALVVGISTLL